EMANLQTFLSAIKATRNSLLVITNPSGTPVYGKNVQNLENIIYPQRRVEASTDMSSVLARVTQPIVPVEKEDFISILRKRLIVSYDKDVANEVEDYLYRKLNYDFSGHYPFHPLLIDVLYNRISLFVNFQKTRDVLKVIALAIKGVLTHLDKADFFVISPADLYFEDPELRALLTDEKVFGSNLEPAVTQDVVASAKKQDEGHVFGKYGRIASAVFLYSLHIEPIRQGITPKEAYLCVTDSQSESDTEQLLGQFYSNYSQFLWFEGGKYLFKSVQNVPNMIKLEANRVLKPEIEKYIKNTLFKDVFESANTKNFTFYRHDSFIPQINRINACVLFHWEDKDSITPKLLSITADKKNTIIVVVPEGNPGTTVYYVKLIIGSEKVLKNVRNNQKLFNEAKNLKQKYDALAVQQFRGLYTQIKYLQGTAVRDIDLDPHKGKTIADSVINRLKQAQKIIDIDNVRPSEFLKTFLGTRKSVQVRTLYSNIEIMTSIPFASRDDLQEIIKQGVKEGAICLFKGMLPEDNVYSGVEKVCERIETIIDIGDTVLTPDYAIEIKQKISNSKKIPEGGETDEPEGTDDGEEGEGSDVIPTPQEVSEFIVADSGDLYEKLRDKLSELQISDMEARVKVEFKGTIQGSVTAKDLHEFRSILDLAEGLSKAANLLGSVKASVTIIKRKMEV
ncbi:hypothetical protein JW865_06595, partial [Candidatus Bathyarchaeota archaeon]|nr:hypothetical protein [Candidatus Bathyarchaeota archaeon]